jgi:hypothetical protein
MGWNSWNTFGADINEALLRDLWAGADRGVFTGSFSVPVDSHDVVLVRITPEA